MKCNPPPPDYKYKNMLRLKNEKEHILHRLKIARGQLTKIISMVENDEYCIDILHNSLSVQKALKKVDAKIMEDHLKHCARHQMQNGDSSKTIEELLTIYNYK
ncbi:hypothetical protein A2862_03255 [Candidatus Roizmanbacteria bacterium RIFCSPHIGHO2_01_FULL_38_41]|uniref:Transcriptional regulator n=1 Tax=Candidatus Roizmanbacteria bacterium RIFCSPHIGHO2_02_FULL_37_24 TaxID=1802037 RepID=A0A1F7GTQ1_9BACT|nr:MAG: hypothetical protein A2862_03255 [Candidatus Roizmanbacteria bacterium RIFCSPHIGHO2_01_FULL_38_41]OGK22459.1 MAG: hypothetical protein A3C24_03970 [Candidatus Roizmanbacteria bacterium RIFCSPHIGHO2_02_FULL_37_24]OGK33110.1 MAG: hypothetical protein A3E10_00890 [Candidatus Roizmanbacteria bacterium RIFCSPHIGHO2_12_FULL_37_23]OGK43449.1 MAG: hypothetical protein A2956_02540 [Candidatus Roizmanbacteria bacterium RIFCSPLOWO2_01_FULL_37_57]OGK61429.1 MAG: hypothetical protein A3G65_00205 [Ca